MPNAALNMTDPVHGGKLPALARYSSKTRSDDAGTFQLHGSSIGGHPLCCTMPVTPPATP
jgi:hypothetical protein